MVLKGESIHDAKVVFSVHHVYVALSYKSYKGKNPLKKSDIFLPELKLFSFFSLTSLKFIENFTFFVIFS